MTKHLSKEEEQVVADEAAAEEAYQADVAKKLKKVALDQLPAQMQDVLVELAKEKLKQEVQKETSKEK